MQDVSARCTDAPLVAAIQAGHVTFVHLDKTQAVNAAAGPSPKETAGDSSKAAQQQEQEQAAAEGGVDGEEGDAAAEAAVAVGRAVQGEASCWEGCDELDLSEEEKD